MNGRMEQVAPRVRRNGLIVREIGNEVLVYDQQEDEAYCLTDVAASLWKHCDGQTPLSEMQGLVALDLGRPVDEHLIYRALADLGKDQLLEDKVAEPAPGTMTRRDLMVRTGVVAAAMIPIISSLQPVAANAQTCTQQGQPCTVGVTTCCGTGGIGKNAGLCCTGTSDASVTTGICGICSNNCCQVNSQCYGSQTCYG